MTSHAPPTRRRRLAALTAVTGLAALLPVLGATTTEAGAAPVEDCAEAYPLSEVTLDQEVDGLTVSRGTVPTEFTGTVLGVITDGISPGIDLIIADLDSPALDAAGGIWQGMSGSPVYAEDGRILGAVSYGLSYGPSPIAGITPFEAMDDYLAAPPERVAVPAKIAQRVAARTDVPARAASRGLTQLEVPMGVAGVPGRVLSRAIEKASGRSWLSRGSMVMGRAAAAPAGPSADDVVAGGNLAASYSYGDVAIAGVGTATSVCEGRVVGFGHPMDFLGDDRTLSLHPASAVYVQPDTLGPPFKVANLGDPVGTITDDHLTGITGAFGAAPEAITVQSHITFGDRERLGTSYVTVPDALAEVAFYQHLGNHNTVVDEEGPGSEVQTWTIEGVDSDGSPFTFRYSDLFASEDSLLFDSAFALPDLLAEMSAIEGVRITSVLNEVVVDPAAKVLRLGTVQQYRGGRFVNVTEGRPALGKAGRPLKLRVNLLGDSRARWRNVVFNLPARTRGWSGAVLVQGGASAGEDEEEEDFKTGVTRSGRLGARAAATTDLDRLLAEFGKRLRSDQVRAQMYLEGRGELVRTVTTGPTGTPISGIKFVSLVVR